MAYSKAWSYLSFEYYWIVLFLSLQFYGETVKEMALRQLIAGSPLRTLCLLISGQPADVFCSSDNSNSLYVTEKISQQPSQVIFFFFFLLKEVSVSLFVSWSAVPNTNFFMLFFFHCSSVACTSNLGVNCEMRRNGYVKTDGRGVNWFLNNIEDICSQSIKNLCSIFSSNLYLSIVSF